MACEKNELDFGGGQCIEVSYVTGICGQAVLKIENPAFQHLGETWNGHEHVFLTEFSCADDMLSKDGKFNIIILADLDLGNCARCAAAIDYNGNKRYPVKRVNNCVPATD